MQEPLVRSLCFQLPQIRERWEALLHAEPVTTPLAHPDALIHLIDWTTSEIFHRLSTPSTQRRPGKRTVCAEYRLECPCGRNPLLTYFAAGEQALHEALVVAQVNMPILDPVERDSALDTLNAVFQAIARREIEAFCGVCQHRAPDHHDADTMACPAANPALAGHPHSG